ncbi:hypothetical protein GR253_16290 [Rhizobium leguminosarum]|nr:hypothetical protein [Rhizobium leguminosarum]
MGNPATAASWPGGDDRRQIERDHGNSASVGTARTDRGHRHQRYLVSQLVAGQRPAVDLAPLRPDRF